MLAKLIDKAVSAFSPVAGLRRAAARQALERLGTYAAADTGRRNRDWKASAGSADLAIVPDARILIPRARQLVRDTWVGQSAVHCVSRNIVGRGIVPVPIARDVTGQELKPFNRRAERLFWEWASDAKFCDVEKRQTFWQKQSLCVEERAVAGEHFLIWSYTPGNSGVGLRFQSMEADQLYDIIQSSEGNQVRGGIEIDEQAAPVAYHFWTRNPNDYLFRTNYKPVRVPLERCFHYFRQCRVRQCRGVSLFAPVMQHIRDLGDLWGSHLWRARMESCVGAVIKSMMAPGTLPGLAAQTVPRAPGDSGTTPGGLPTVDFVPGMTAFLRPGEEIEFHNPQVAGGNFDPFTKAILRGIAAGLNMSYEQLVRDFSQGTYSSQRQGMLEDRRAWQQEQDALIDTLIAPMYRLFIRCAFLEGKFEDLVPIQEFLASPSRFTDAEFIPDGHQWIDPVKEASAAKIALELRLTTRKELITARGGRLRNTFEQIADEAKLGAQLGIAFPENQVPAFGGAGAGPAAPGTGTAAKPAAPVPAATPAPDPDEEREPSFGDESVALPGEDDDDFLPEASAPITASGKGFSAPSDTFGPNDVFDNVAHNPSEAPVSQLSRRALAAV